MTHDLLTLSDECRQSQIDAIALLSALSPHFNKTITQISETLCNSFSALREAHVEIEKAHAIFGPDTTIEMLEDGLEARAELPKLRAELETANALIKRHEDALEWMSQEQHSIHSYSYDCGNSYGVYSNGDRRYISEAKSTPLDAIEAATKEQA